MPRRLYGGSRLGELSKRRSFPPVRLTNSLTDVMYCGAERVEFLTVCVRFRHDLRESWSFGDV